MASPVFIKANVEFTVEQTTLEFKNKNISLYGVAGLPWAPLTPSKHFGKTVSCTIRTQTEKPVTLTTSAIVSREQTAFAESIMLKFVMDPKQEALLKETINQFGFFPNEGNRKYPRIPSSNEIQTFPLRILASPLQSEMDKSFVPVIFDVIDLSLGGVLVSTENPFSLSLHPNSRLVLHLEPRGDFSLQIAVQAMVCRVMEDVNPLNGNIVRFFGLKFTKVDEENRIAFLELLKDILMRIRKSNEQARNKPAA